MLLRGTTEAESGERIRVIVSMDLLCSDALVCQSKNNSELIENASQPH